MVCYIIISGISIYIYSVTFKFFFRRKSGDLRPLFGCISKNTYFPAANVFGRRPWSLDLAAGQLPDLEIHIIPTPISKEHTQKRISQFAFWGELESEIKLELGNLIQNSAIRIWITLDLGNFIQNSAIGIWIKLDLGNFIQHSWMFSLLKFESEWNSPFWNAHRILQVAQAKNEISKEQTSKKKRRFPGTFWCVFSV